MLLPLDQQPDHARLWVYQASRPLSEAEADYAQGVLEQQTAQWAAHGQALAGSVRVLHRRFVVVAVDPEQNLPSGCSIDASTHWLKALGAEMNVDFFDRALAYWAEDEVKTWPLSGLKAAVATGHLQPDTPVFNTLAPTLGHFRRQAQLPAAESWAKRYFSQKRSEE